MVGVKRFLALKSLNVILITASAMFMAQLDSSVLVIALPQIAEDFDLPIVSLSLAISIYLTMIVAMLPISGWAADRYGRSASSWQQLQVSLSSRLVAPCRPASPASLCFARSRARAPR